MKIHEFVVDMDSFLQQKYIDGKRHKELISLSQYDKLRYMSMEQQAERDYQSLFGASLKKLIG